MLLFAKGMYTDVICYTGSRSCLSHAAVVGLYEEQAERCRDRPQSAEAQERSIDKVIFPSHFRAPPNNTVGAFERLRGE